MNVTKSDAGKPRVLLIDDSEIAVEAARAVLEGDGFDVRTAHTLGEFNVILKTWKPNIVLTDVNMPGVSGPELCKWIKVRIDTEGVPVVFFSDLPDPVLEAVARAAGADGFLSKSHGLGELSAELHSIYESIVW
jgi:twitching motility two-component system response regulator PilH